MVRCFLLRFFQLAIVTGLFLLVLAVPTVVMAADAAVGGVPPGANPWWHMVLVQVFIGLGSVILGMLGKGLTMLFDWLAIKTGLEWMRGVDDMIMDIVQDTYASTSTLR